MHGQLQQILTLDLQNVANWNPSSVPAPLIRPRQGVLARHGQLWQMPTLRLQDLKDEPSPPCLPLARSSDA
eukprot:7344444-Karenia_brevis.AAC.1